MEFKGKDQKIIQDLEETIKNGKAYLNNGAYKTLSKEEIKDYKIALKGLKDVLNIKQGKVQAVRCNNVKELLSALD